MPSLADIARTTATENGMFADAPVVLALVSGGADSVAMLRLLADGALGQMAQLSVLHVDHGLRGADAREDADFVAGMCASLGVPCRIARYDVAAYAAAERLNVEDAGRRVRYRFAADELDARCEALGADAARGRIAVAHTLDDRLETLLARLVSGAGAGGLSSIVPVSGRVIRPLLDARRADVVAYLTGIGQSWREDATNADTTRERAWVRHVLVPTIEDRNPAFAVTASRTMRILADEDRLLAEMAAAFAHDFTRLDGTALVVDRAPMRTLTTPMARRTLRSAIISAFPEASRLEFEHVEALLEGLTRDAFARDLPFGLRAEAEYDTLRISRRADSAEGLAPALLELPGMAELGQGGTVTAREAPVGDVAGGPLVVSIDADSVSWPLAVDGVRDGDRIRPIGMDGTRKVSDVLIDAKVPRRLRSATPVVRDGDRIVWVAGVRLADDYKVTPATRRTAELEWSPLTGGQTQMPGTGAE